MELRLNGEIEQSSKTSEVIFPVPDLFSFISSVITLMPGDVLATGTPSGVGPVETGDVIEVDLEGIGVLRNSVAQD